MIISSLECLLIFRFFLLRPHDASIQAISTHLPIFPPSLLPPHFPYSHWILDSPLMTFMWSYPYRSRLLMFVSIFSTLQASHISPPHCIHDSSPMSLILTCKTIAPLLCSYLLRMRIGRSWIQHLFKPPSNLSATLRCWLKHPIVPYAMHEQDNGEQVHF